MTFPQTTDVLIVGGGPAGLSAARTCEEYQIDYLLVEAGLLGGQLLWTHNTIHDYLGVNPMTGREFLERVLPRGRAADNGETAVIGRATERGQTQEPGQTLNKAEESDHRQRGILTGWTVRSLNAKTQTAELVSSGDNRCVHHLRYRAVVLASGSRPRQLGIPGEDLEGVKGPHFSTSVHADDFAGKVLAVVGGGDRALEGAIRCADAGAFVIVIHRRNAFRAKSDFVRAVLGHPRITVRFETIVERITGRFGALTLTLKARQDEALETLVSDAVLIRIGVEPNTDLVRRIVRCSPNGYIEVDGFGRTSVRGIYAAGDVCAPAWAARLQTAVASGLVAVRTILQDGHLR